MMGETSKFVFFLGGRDLEMVTIGDLLAEHASRRFHDKELPWGAKASAYRSEIEDALTHRKMPVLIELAIDLPLDRDRVIVIDHHGERAGAEKPTALEQVFDLLGLPSEAWTRWHTLVAANDRGYIPELLVMGATPEEIRQVRAADRAAQGVTSEEEAEAERGIAQGQLFLGGRLMVVWLGHNRASSVVDRLESTLGGPGFENLLVISPDQVNFFGIGELVDALNEMIPGGWYGGALPDRGFWGHLRPLVDIVSFLCERLDRSRTAGRR